jgi:hypothetical protein
MFVAALGAGVCVVGSAFADSAPTPMPTPDSSAPPAVATTAPSHDKNARPADDDDEERTANNALYAEGLGAGLFYSLNYERSFGDFAGRIGFGYLSVSASSSDPNGQESSSASASIFTVPLTISYLGIGTKTNIFELGAGATILHVGEGASFVDTDSSSTASGSTTLVLPHVVVGYRHMPPDGGFLFKAGVTALVAGDSIPVLPWPYVAFGAAF